MDIRNSKFCKNLNMFQNPVKLKNISEKLICNNQLNSFEAEREVLDNLQKIKLMQFLGLRDKNGHLIYFGDILVDNMNNLLTPVIEIENAEHVLFFKPIKHLNQPLLNIGCKSTYSETLEVIGNIYINSELFSGVKETDKLLNILKSIQKTKLLQKNIQTEIKHQLNI